MRTVICAAMLVLAAKSSATRWVHQEHVSGLTDERTTIWGLPADDDTLGVYLSISCKGNQTIFAFTLGRFVGPDSVQIQYRLDRGPIQTRAFFPLNGRTLAISGRDAIRLLVRMQTSQRFVVSDGRREAIFALAGIEEAISDVSKACRWGSLDTMPPSKIDDRLPGSEHLKN